MLYVFPNFWNSECAYTTDNIVYSTTDLQWLDNVYNTGEIVEGGEEEEEEEINNGGFNSGGGDGGSGGGGGGGGGGSGNMVMVVGVLLVMIMFGLYLIR